MFSNNLWGLIGRGTILIFPLTSTLWAFLCRFEDEGVTLKWKCGKVLGVNTYVVYRDSVCPDIKGKDNIVYSVLVRWHATVSHQNSFNMSWYRFYRMIIILRTKPLSWHSLTFKFCQVTSINVDGSDRKKWLDTLFSIKGERWLGGMYVYLATSSPKSHLRTVCA